MHPDGKAHGGSAILIKSKIHHHESTHYCTQQIQSTNVITDDWIGELQISAVYSPPKHFFQPLAIDSMLEVIIMLSTSIGAQDLFL